MKNHDFPSLLIDCLNECAQGRPGLFAPAAQPWPEAEILRCWSSALTEPGEVAYNFHRLCQATKNRTPNEARLAAALLELATVFPQAA